MKLLEKLKEYNVSYLNDIPYFKINDFNIFYHTFQNKEYLCLLLHRSLISLNDLKELNYFEKGIAKIKVSSVALKNDLLYIDFYEYNDLYHKLLEICDFLKEFNYHGRELCILCGQKASLVSYDSFLIPLDDKCYHKLKNEDQELLNNQKTKFKKALLLGLLGGLIGLMPALIVSYILASYSLISNILLFLIPFLSVIFFYRSGLNHLGKNDLYIHIISLFYYLIYHLLLVIICVNESNITSIKEYFNVYKTFFIESILFSIFTYLIGYFAAIFLSKNKVFVRFKKLR